MTTPELTGLLRDAHWRTATRSASTNCVEVATLDRANVAVRDSKDRGGPVLFFGRDAWQGFVAGIRAGDFDRA
ncbi:hypothetical protein GCM10010124_06950 [Pilimelia terevasa]|uniref:DUF397 domain-containing protein n=1 Tax=Pilimelia terevasa TaxID=53372 RepID=A0A8J3BIE4_9ACTN|nr:DUF397 domain-containing protein [Pilimelia terevasa]GGK17015.1 hypothetical protein GCM10010124_06950 [Pilimelia terevasa]